MTHEMPAPAQSNELGPRDQDETGMARARRKWIAILTSSTSLGERAVYDLADQLLAEVTAAQEAAMQARVEPIYQYQDAESGSHWVDTDKADFMRRKAKGFAARAMYSDLMQVSSPQASIVDKSTADFALSSALMQMQGMYALMQEFKIPAARAANCAAHVESAIRAVHRAAEQAALAKPAPTASPAEENASGMITLARHETILGFARSSAKQGAFRELLRMFPRARGRIANLLAHKWEITAVEMRTKFGVEDVLAERPVPAAERFDMEVESVRKLRAERSQSTS